MMPHIVSDDRRLDIYARDLYRHYSRVCGASSICWQSDATIASATGMSVRRLRDARDLLKYLGYITAKRAPHGITVEIVQLEADHLQKTIALGPLILKSDRHQVPERSASGADKEEPSEEEPIRRLI